MNARLALAAAAALLAGCAHAPADDPADPLEPVNRAVFAFNAALDQGLVKPLAKGYDKVTPAMVREGIANFFSNLFYPTTILNDLLQLKLAQGAQDIGRFLFNSTFGLAGLIDVAEKVGLDEHDEDFGQTLGYWGVGEGWFLTLPILGPSSNRDFLGRIGDGFSNPMSYVDNDISLPANVVYAIERRTQLLGADALLDQQFDKYIFIRSVYLQRRQNAVYDGNPPKEDYDFDDDE